MTTPAGCTRTLSPADAPQLQSIVDAARDGDVLCLGPGTYDVNLIVRNHVSLRGTPGDGAQAVILDGGGRGPVLQLWADGGALAVSALTIRGGSAQQTIAAGGVYAHGTAEVTFERVNFTANACDLGGAQALYTDAAQVVLDRCTVQDNYGDRAATIVVESIAQLTVKGSQVTGNEGKRALAVRDAAQLTLENTTVEAITVALEIGGNPTQNPSATLRGSTLSANTAIANGPIPGQVQLERCAIKGVVSGPFQDGGGNTLSR